MLKVIYLFGLVVLVYSCENGSQNPIDDPVDSKVDSLVYDIYVTTSEAEITQMEKYDGSTLVERIEILYSDSIVEKRIFHYDSLLYKGVFHLNQSDLASYSFDSFFYQEIFFETKYSYDGLGYLIEEKHIPGLYYLKDFGMDSSEYTMFKFINSNGNLLKDEFMLAPPNILSTGFLDFKYSDLPLLYDIISYENSIIGKPNRNLPNKFGWQEDVPPGSFLERIRYEYVIEDSTVTKRTDFYVVNGTMTQKLVMNYRYN